MRDAPHRVPNTTGHPSSMVGRSAERVLLAEQLAAMQAGQGSLVIIGGEAGIGKTTLARAFIAQARDTGTVTLAGHGQDLTAAAPYSLWLDLVDRYRHAPPLPDAPAPPAELADRELGTVASQAALFGAVLAFLRELAATAPTVVVLEDVHWADPASLELLRYVAARVHDTRLLLLVTYRDDELTRRVPFYQHLPALVREAGGLRLDLHRLTPEELDSLVKQHYAMAPADRAQLVRYLAAHAEGNPFFALELLRALEDQQDGGLIRTEDGWQLGDLDRAIVPPLVLQVIDTRVSRLGERLREPLAIAAVIGHQVDPALLAAVSGLPIDAVLDCIDAAIDGHLLTATPDGSGVQFFHALTRTALHMSIAPHRRTRIHGRVAEALMREPWPHVDAIAWHLQQAGDPRAPEWLIRAGDRAQRAYAWRTAEERFATAAALLAGVPGEDATRARLLYRCGRLLRYVDAPTAIERLYDAARIAEQAGDAVLTADAIYSRGLVQCFADRLDTGLADMIHGVELLEALPPREAWVPSSTAAWMADALPTLWATRGDEIEGTLTAIGPARHRSLPWFLAAAGRIHEARDLAIAFDDGMPDTGIGPLALANMAHAEFGRGTACAALGLLGEATEAFARARERYRRLDHHAVLAFVDLTELLDAHLVYRTDDLAGRQRLADAASDEIERAHGAVPAEVLPAIAHLPLMVLDGRWDEALRIADACQAPGTYVLRRPLTLTRATISAARGDIAAAWAEIDALLPRGPDASPGSAVLPDALLLQRIATTLALDAGDLDLARRWLDANERWLAWSGSVQGRAEAATLRARLHLAAGELDLAGEAADRALALAADPRQPLALIGAHQVRGAVAFAHGDRETAAREGTDALRLSMACELPWEAAQTRVMLARVHRPRDRDGAAALAREALETAKTLGAAPLVAAAEQLLGAAPDPATPPAGLTHRELDVLGLVAQGLTDAEIGDQLFISPRTVGQHLRSIYGKLAVRSRTEATRLALERGLV